MSARVEWTGRLAAYAMNCSLIMVLSGCASEMVWTRTDGQHMRDNPALISQFEVDRTICQGEGAKAYDAGMAINGIQNLNRVRAAEDVQKGCMAQRGYLLKPKSSDSGS